LPKGAIENIPTKVQERLPEHLQDNFVPPPPEVNLVFDTLASSTLGGTAGEADVFVFDLTIYPRDQLSSEVISGFESDLDTIAFINMSDTNNVFFTSNQTVVASGAVGAIQVTTAFTTYATGDISAATDASVTLQNGFTYLLADLS
jgi:hypothetical protein